MQRLKAEEEQKQKAETCDGCGQPRDKSMASENQFKYQAELTRCHACAEITRKQEKFAKQKNSDTSGIKVRLVKTPE